MATSIRRYRPDDASATRRVFDRAIRVTAAADYTPEQIEAWAGGVDPAGWAARRASAATWVAERDGAVVGFTDIDDHGYIDMMFVDPEVGRSGIAGALLAHVTAIAAARGLSDLSVNASETARPFFARYGFVVEASQEVVRAGIVLTNHRMTRRMGA
ncbi:GNAT family N-acetyltransferase [Microbacterium sp. 179-I 3D3 NHS]|uniref:GNAT family N-acetyltransferase n=1 Tax=Microbacterium sp. 179-I 3D3 NHS TaxID=3142382 RepID=UPI0039A0D964